MRRIAVFLTVVVMVALAGASPASSEDVTVEVGWWTSNPTATAPERGLAVSSGPSGAITVSAIRASLTVTTIDTATLTLAEEGGVQQSGAQLQVCPTPNAWTAGPKQSLDKAPKPECDKAKVPLTRAADGKWTADVRNVLSSSSAGEKTSPSLMIVPAGSGAVPLGFEVRFQPPKLTVTGSSSSGSSDSTSSTFSSSSSSSSDFASTSSTDSSSTSSSSSTFAGSGAGSFASPTIDRGPLPSFSSAQLSGTIEDSPTAQDTAAAAAVAPAVATASPVGGRTAPSGPVPRGSRGLQALFFIAVATVIGVGVGFGHARVRPEGANVV
ncbi:MAG TPA: hypothetical protein VM143_09835 [Acidimicrobiales bacterium]|nr:hypothetical protein [Acidimicrobiales bacterium]